MQNDYGKKVTKGIQEQVEPITQMFSIVTMEEGNDSKAMQGEFCLTVITPLGRHDQVHHLGLLDELLVEFEDFFIEPTSLPPTRMYDHAINLKPNAEPINIRSYRYPPNKK